MLAICSSSSCFCLSYTPEASETAVSSILSAKLSIAWRRFSLDAVRISMSLSRVLSLSPFPKREEKPPNVTVSRIPPTPFNVLSNGLRIMSPLNTSLNIPSTAPKTISCRSTKMEDTPPFSTSMIPSTPPMIPVGSMFAKASPIFPPTIPPKSCSPSKEACKEPDFSLESPPATPFKELLILVAESFSFLLFRSNISENASTLPLAWS